MEMRVVTGILVNRFDIEIALGDEGTRMPEDTRDAIAALPEKLQSVLRARGWLL